MPDRENQKRLDAICLRYLAALDADDEPTIAAIIDQAATDADLMEALNELHAEIVAEDEARG